MNTKNQFTEANLKLRKKLLINSSSRVVLYTIACIAYLVLFLFSTLRHELFNSSGDLAFFDQAVYLISQGQPPISSIIGFHALADHASVILYLLALLYKVYPSVYWLFTVQSGALALGCLPVYFLALQAGLKNHHGLVMVFVYLLYPVIYNSDLCDFHPDTIAVPTLLTAVLAARSGNIFWFCVSLLVVLSCKSVLSLTVIGLGAWLFFGEKRRLFGVIALASGSAWFVIANWVIIPYFGGQAAAISRHLYRYSYLGNSFPEALKTLVFQPQKILANLFSRVNGEYLLLLLAPVAWGLTPKYVLPLIGAVPCLALNLMADTASQKNLVLHYSLPVVPFLLLAVIESLAAGKSWIQQRRTIILWSLISFLALGKYGFFTGRYLKSLDTLQATREAIALVKTPDSLVTTGWITPHLAHRKLIKFDDSQTLNQLKDFHYILYNTHHHGLSYTSELIQSLVNYLKNRSDFKLIYQRNNVYLFVKYVK